MHKPKSPGHNASQAGSLNSRCKLRWARSYRVNFALNSRLEFVAELRAAFPLRSPDSVHRRSLCVPSRARNWRSLSVAPGGSL